MGPGKDPGHAPVGVLIVNDSATVRASLRMALGGAEGIAVVGEASGGVEALELVRKRSPDLVLLDVVMSGMDGYAATRAIMAEAPTPIVLMSGVVDTRDVATAMEALRAGALAIVEQLPPRDDPSYRSRVEALARLCRAMSRVRMRPAPPPAVPVVPRARRPEDGRVAAIGVVASTGGPPVLAEILGAMPTRGLPPILVVQHIAAGFVDGFAQWLGRTTGHDVRVAGDGARAAPGTVWIAPHDRHLRAARDGALILGDDPPVGHFRPSGDALLRSLAPFGAEAIGLVLSGMGEDGAEGAATLAAAGGIIVAQDEASAAVWGMPQAAVRRGCVTRSLPPAGIASWLLDRVGVAARA